MGQAIVRLYLLTHLVCIQVFSASTQKNNEWIAIRSDVRISWGEITKGFSTLEYEHSFGPLNNLAFYKGKRKLREKLPKGLKFLQPNYLYHTLEKSDSEFSKSWGLSNTGQELPGVPKGIAGVDIGALAAWTFHTGSSSIVVGILDSGIDLNHEDLKTNRWKNPGEVPSNGVDDDGNGFVDDLGGWNFVDGNSQIQDDNNHGSFVSGIIGADWNNGKGSRGILSKVGMMTVKILDKDGMSTTERAVKGIEYAVKNGAKLINASWGGVHFDQALFDTIKWANERGVLFVAAAGNDGKNNDLDDKPVYPASFHLENIVAVAAYDNQDKLAGFSNYGKENVHIGAPGVAIFSPIVGGYKIGEGTSFAVPFVVGVAALVKSLVPTLSVSELKDRILKSSVPLDYYAKEKLQSAGRINAYNALKNIRPPRPTVPTQWKRFLKNSGTPHPYTNDNHQSFEFSHPGATHLRVHFVNFDLEKNYDLARIVDKEGREVEGYTGKLGSFWSSDVLGDILRIDFKSDFSNTAFGFDVDAYEISE